MSYTGKTPSFPLGENINLKERQWDLIRSRPLPQDNFYKTNSSISTNDNFDSTILSNESIHGPQSPSKISSDPSYLHPEHHYSKPPVCHLFSPIDDPFDRIKTSIVPQMSIHHWKSNTEPIRSLNNVNNTNNPTLTSIDNARAVLPQPTLENFYGDGMPPCRYDGLVTSHVVHGSQIGNTSSVVVHTAANGLPGRHSGQMTLKNTCLDVSEPEKPHPSSIKPLRENPLKHRIPAAEFVGLNQWIGEKKTFTSPHLRQKSAGLDRMVDPCPVQLNACFKEHRNFETPHVLGRFCAPPEAALCAARRPIETDPAGDKSVNFGQSERADRVARVYGPSSTNHAVVSGTIDSLKQPKITLVEKHAMCRVPLGAARMQRMSNSGVSAMADVSFKLGNKTNANNNNSQAMTNGDVSRNYRPVIQTLMKLR